MKFWKKLTLTLAIALPLPVFAGTAATVYKSPTCSCCEAYVDHLRENGFDVEVVSTHDMAAVKEERHVPAQQQSCHTTVVGPYVFEGHIPLASVNKVLEERPFIRGLAVPGMPAGSPGMGGQQRGPIDVYYLSDAAEPEVFAQH